VSTPEQEAKLYPGSIDRYRELRAQREAAQASTDVPDGTAVLTLTLCEELAGLAYLLDGIRYSLRQKQ